MGSLGHFVRKFAENCVHDIRQDQRLACEAWRIRYASLRKSLFISIFQLISMFRVTRWSRCVASYGYVWLNACIASCRWRLTCHWQQACHRVSADGRPCQKPDRSFAPSSVFQDDPPIELII